jgi:hypothetical protein
MAEGMGEGGGNEVGGRSCSGIGRGGRGRASVKADDHCDDVSGTGSAESE